MQTLTEEEIENKNNLMIEKLKNIKSNDLYKGIENTQDDMSVSEYNMTKKHRFNLINKDLSKSEIPNKFLHKNFSQIKILNQDTILKNENCLTLMSLDCNDIKLERKNIKQNTNFKTQRLQLVSPNINNNYVNKVFDQIFDKKIQKQQNFNNLKQNTTNYNDSNNTLKFTKLNLKISNRLEKEKKSKGYIDNKISTILTKLNFIKGIINYTYPKVIVDKIRAGQGVLRRNSTSFNNKQDIEVNNNLPFNKTTFNFLSKTERSGNT